MPRKPSDDAASTAANQVASLHDESGRIRFERSMGAWIDKYGYLNHGIAIMAAKAVLRQGDREVALLFCRQARAYAEENLKNALERLDRLEHQIVARSAISPGKQTV